MMNEITVLDITLMSLYYREHRVFATPEFIIVIVGMATYFYSKEPEYRNKVAFIKHVRTLYNKMHPESSAMIGLKESKDLIELLEDSFNRSGLLADATTRLDI